MRLTDMHCDTPLEIYRNKSSLLDGNTAFTVEKCKGYESVMQVMAFWSDPKKTPDECYSDFISMFDYLSCEIEKANDSTGQDKSFYEKFKFIPAVEGARLLGGDLTRLSVLKSYGVKILTPVWGGIEEAGGAFDSQEGLTDFGKSLVKECEKLGITIDVSHMSDKSFWDTVNISERPIIASHSNSKVLCNHARNLTDIQFRTIAECKGLVGVSTVAKYISTKYSESMPSDAKRFVKEFCDHIEHFLNLGGVSAVCLGCDFDGTDSSCGLEDVSCMERVYEELLARNICKDVVEAVMWKNASDFFDRLGD